MGRGSEGPGLGESWGEMALQLKYVPLALARHHRDTWSATSWTTLYIKPLRNPKLEVARMAGGEEQTEDRLQFHQMLS